MTAPKGKVWVLGMGRTGTVSMCAALRILGYRRVVHNPRFSQLRRIDAAADNGCTIFYKYLDYKFPQSKFVLLTRELESWLSSIEYIYNEHPITKRDDTQIARRMLLYETVSFDREKLIDAYHRHHADVRRYFADRPDKLLEMDLTKGEGWEKVCPFLELPVPSVPFPRTHKRGERPIWTYINVNYPVRSISSLTRELLKRARAATA